MSEHVEFFLIFHCMFILILLYLHKNVIFIAALFICLAVQLIYTAQKIKGTLNSHIGIDEQNIKVFKSSKFKSIVI